MKRAQSELFDFLGSATVIIITLVALFLVRDAVGLSVRLALYILALLMVLLSAPGILSFINILVKERENPSGSLPLETSAALEESAEQFSPTLSDAATQEGTLQFLVAAGSELSGQIIRLREILVDTSPEVRENAIAYVSEYEKLVNHVRNPQKLDSSKLLLDLEDLGDRSSLLLERHREEVENLRREYTALSNRMKGLEAEIAGYLSHTPRFNSGTLEKLSELQKEGYRLRHDSPSEGYKQLTLAIHQIHKWQGTAESFLRQCHKMLEMFQNAKQNVENQIRATSTEVKLQRTYTDRKWPWYQAAVNPIFDAAENELRTAELRWTNLKGQGWSGLTIYQATAACDELTRGLQDTLSQLNSRRMGIQQRQFELHDEFHDVVKLSITKSQELSPTEQQLVRQCLLAAKSQQRDYLVERYLSSATFIVEKRIGKPAQIENLPAFAAYSQGGTVITDKRDIRHGRESAGEVDE
jgi:hypothetical protein